VRLTAQTVMGNGPTAVSEFKNGIGRRVELENRYGSLAHREFKSLPLRHSGRGPTAAEPQDWVLAPPAGTAAMNKATPALSYGRGSHRTTARSPKSARPDPAM